MKLNIHPDDLLFFNEVASKMRQVAKQYQLPLRSITHDKMPVRGLHHRYGACSVTGDIVLVLRATENGQWCDGPLSPSEVWDTAAHELAHLRHMNHGEAFHEFYQELRTALTNVQEDHREKIIAKLVKMQAQKEGEAAIGNTAAAEAFAAAINRMLLEHELHPSEIDYARTADRDPVIEVPVQLSDYRIEKVSRRVAWQEALARIVAKANLCTWLLQKRSNNIWFVGTKSHATVAEYTYGTLVHAAEKMSLQARHEYREELRREHGIPSGHSLRGVASGFGFREAWLTAFIDRIGQRFEEARRAAVAEADASLPPGSASTALIRLSGQLAKAQAYVDDKFKGRKGLGAVHGRFNRNNAEGAARGRAAADRMAIGRKALTHDASGRKLLS